MSFEDYQKTVINALDRWLDALFNGGSQQQIADRKEQAEDMINGWKDNFPRQKEKISAMVSEYLAVRFDRNK